MNARQREFVEAGRTWVELAQVNPTEDETFFFIGVREAIEGQRMVGWLRWLPVAFSVVLLVLALVIAFHQ